MSRVVKIPTRWRIGVTVRLQGGEVLAFETESCGDSPTEAIDNAELEPSPLDDLDEGQVTEMTMMVKRVS